MSNQLIHMSDWLPTFSGLAGFRIPIIRNVDGIDMWRALSEELPSRRVDVVHNVDPIVPYSSYLHGQWKYVNGTVNPQLDTWMGNIAENENPDASNYLRIVRNTTTWSILSRRRERTITESEMAALRRSATVQCKAISDAAGLTPCDPLKAPCLFNIREDPCEQDNLADTYPLIRVLLQQKLQIAKLKVKYPLNVPPDPKCDPALNCYQWTYWSERDEIVCPAS